MPDCGNFEAAVETYEQALDIAREVAGTRLIAEITAECGRLYLWNSKLLGARAVRGIADRVPAIAAAPQDIRFVLLEQLALRKWTLSERQQVPALALPLLQKAQSPRTVADVTLRLGDLELAEGHPQEAQTQYSNALAAYRQIGDLCHGVATVVRGMGDLSLRQGDAVEARRLWEQALEQFQQLARPDAKVMLGRLAQVEAPVPTEATQPVTNQASIYSIEQELRFPLRPLSERASLNALEDCEQAFLSNTADPGLPSRHAQLRLLIVIPAFNEGETIRDVLQSLCTQDVPSEQMEVLVIDNGSSDGTASAVLQFACFSPVSIHFVTHRAKEGLLAHRANRNGRCVRTVGSGLSSKPGTDRHDRRRRPGRPGLGRDPCRNGGQQQGRHGPGAGPRRSPRYHRTWTGWSRPVRRREPGECVCRTGTLARGRSPGRQRGASYSRWMPRITGPNFAITGAAYVAAGGLDPRPPGDQASHLANALLRSGGADRSLGRSEADPLVSRAGSRSAISTRPGGTASGSAWALRSWRRPGRGSARPVGGLPGSPVAGGRIAAALLDLGAGHPATRAAAGAFAAGYLGCPVDPSALWRYGAGPHSRRRLPLLGARALLIEMSRRAGGIDYRAGTNAALPPRNIFDRRFSLAVEPAWTRPSSSSAAAPADGLPARRPARACGRGSRGAAKAARRRHRGLVRPCLLRDGADLC